MFAVVGSGFGLYGYLPALVETFGEPVLLPEAYRPKVEARRELDPYREAIRWTADIPSALARATGVVIATPPRRQVEVAGQCLAMPSIRALVLEKPLAPDPEAAEALLAALQRSGKQYLLGYTLLDTQWHSRLALPRASEASGIAIEWRFMAHHFAQDLANWKREHVEGGGVLRFFGVHLVALLAHHGYRDATASSLEGVVRGEPERWRATFAGPGLPLCRVEVDSRSNATTFRILGEGPAATLVDLRDPYAAEPPQGEADRRVAVLQRFLATLLIPDPAREAFHVEVNWLWRRVEEAARGSIP